MPHEMPKLYTTRNPTQDLAPCSIKYLAWEGEGDVVPCRMK